jgi:hypothetical protein
MTDNKTSEPISHRQRLGRLIEELGDREGFTPEQVATVKRTMRCPLTANEIEALMAARLGRNTETNGG